MQRSISAGNQHKNALEQMIKAGDRGARGTTPTQRIIMLGSGAMYDWARGRSQFQEMKNFIEKEVPKHLGDGWVVDIHWLGYPKMDIPFEANATLSSIELSASGIQRAVDDFPDATFDFVCHSLAGLVTLYWSLKFAKPEHRRRVNSIITINSPLAPYSALAEACERYIEKYGTMFGQPYVPSFAVELKDGSSVSGLVTHWSLPIHLLNVYTVGDEIVPPDIAKVAGRSDEYEFYSHNRGGPLDKHRQALRAREVHEKVISTICTHHLKEFKSL